MKTKCLAFIIAVIFHNFHNTSLAAPGGAVRLAGLTPVSEMYLGQEVLSLDKHKSTNTVLLAGKAFRDGIGVEAGSALVYALKGGYKRLEIKAGIGPEGKGFYSDRTVRFAVYGDGRLLYRGGGRRWGDEPESINVPLEGVQRLELATRGRLEAESDPRAAFWAEGQLYTADKPAGGVAAAALRAESAAGSDMRLSAFGEDGLLPEEYRFLREFVEETGYQLGTDLLIIRNGAAAALDIAPAIINAGGFFTVSPHLYSWNHEYFPIRHRTYAVHKMLHGISRKKPEVVRFNKTAADPVLTKADRKKLESFLNSLGAWNRGDLLLIEKEGIEVSLKSGPEESNLGMMKTFEPENYKIYQAAPGLNLLEEFKSLAGDRA
ncbi:MAG: NPCBM/NEW2 domain-containing protein, partial [Elusimicrobia bacterium]|nr:NPCBM/NEW2 domain-containing protein [Elusimicrobiota bacterium]